MKRNNFVILLFSFLFLLTACSKEKQLGMPEKKALQVDPSKVFHLPTSMDEIQLVENIKKVSNVFQELYKDPKNSKLVSAAILSKTFTDESVFLSSLIYPQNSRVGTKKRFKSISGKWGVSLESFAENFWREVKKLNDSEFEAYLASLLANEMQPDRLKATEATLGANGENTGTDLTIYFPYHEDFLPQDPIGDIGDGYGPITTIAAATADADEGFGEMPYYVNGQFQYYVTVLINDDFCSNNPTHIIGVNGIETYDGPEDGGTPPPPPPPPPGVSRVYIGEGICRNQYDKLISFTGNGGGSEIKYCRLSGYLQPANGQVTSFQDIVSFDFSRRGIRNQIWNKNYTVWDDDWHQNDNEQVLAIYEEDNTNTRTFNGSLGTTITFAPGTTGTGTIGFNVSVASQDDIIRQFKISRNSYFAGAFQNQGKDFSMDATFLPLPFTHGWPAYDVHYWTKVGANVGWTWPYNTF